MPSAVEDSDAREQPLTSPTSSTAAFPASFDYVLPFESVSNLLCPICRAPFVDPWMSVPCEHFYCHTCILQHLSSSLSSTCPCDRRPIDLDAGQLVPAPRLVKLLCDELEVQCARCEAWKGQRQHFSNHAAGASCKSINADGFEGSAPARTCKHLGCSNAAFKTRASLERHETEDCPHRPIKCNMCGDVMLAIEVEGHSATCSNVQISCPKCELADLTRAELLEHTTSACPEAKVTCEYARYGCKWRGKRKHLRSSHLELDCPYERLKEYLSASDQTLEGLKKENASLRSEITSLQTTYSELSRRVNQLDARLGDASHSGPDSPISRQIAGLSSQMTSLSSIASSSRRTAEQSHTDLRADLNAMQLSMHDLRGELIALQQAQYYETASRFWSRSGVQPLGGDASSSLLRSNSEESTAAGGKGSNTNVPLHPLAGPGGMHMPMPGIGAYPFPLYGPLLPGQSMYTTPHPILPTGRRFYGWPYMPPGGTSPEGAPKL